MNKILKVYTQKIKDNLDCDGWMHSMYFRPQDLGFKEEEIDRLIFVDCWRPKTLRDERKNKLD